MSVFKVGQRVRFIGPVIAPAFRDHSSYGDLIGSEAVIVRRSGGDFEWVIKGDALRNGVSRGGGLGSDEIQCDSCHIVPLTDPKADAFIESVRKWKPEPVVPLPAKVKA